MARPRVDLSEKEIAQIEALAGYGLPENAIAHALGISVSTLARRKEDTKRVAVAVARGKAKAQGLIGEALFRRAKAGDVPAIKWWEQTRLGYRDAQSVQHAGPDGGAIPHEVTVRFVEPQPEQPRKAKAARRAR